MHVPENKVKIELKFDSAITLLDVYLKEYATEILAHLINFRTSHNSQDTEPTLWFYQQIKP